MLGLVAAAQFLGMTLWFSATAVAPTLVTELGLTPRAAAWLTMAVQLGFVAGTLASAVLNLPDVFNPRRLFVAGCLLGAAANGLLLTVTGAPAIITLRVVTGIALAGVYPPGLQIAVGWFGARSGAALGIVVGALTLGSAFPHLLVGLSASVDWRLLIAASSGFAIAAGAIVGLTVRDGPYQVTGVRFDPSAAFDVFRARGTRLATLGYVGHMWELYAMWTWVAAFATASLGAAGVVEAARSGSLVAFVAIGSGALGCVAAGFAADRVGKARVAGGALGVSALCAAGAGLAFGGRPEVLLALAAVWGVSVVADSAQFSALVAEYSPREHVGTALTVQTSVGFLVTLATIRLTGLAADTYGWQWVFLILVPGPVLGAWAMTALTRRPPSGAETP